MSADGGPPSLSRSLPLASELTDNREAEQSSAFTVPVVGRATLVTGMDHDRRDGHAVGFRQSVAVLDQANIWGWKVDPGIEVLAVAAGLLVEAGPVDWRCHGYGREIDGAGTTAWLRLELANPHRGLYVDYFNVVATIPLGTRVEAGEPVGRVDKVDRCGMNFGMGLWSGAERRLDPFGWNGPGADPLEQASGYGAVNLFDVKAIDVINLVGE